jgi:hypothetical protein
MMYVDAKKVSRGFFSPKKTLLERTSQSNLLPQILPSKKVEKKTFGLIFM